MSASHLSSLALDQLAMNLLSPAEAADARAHLESCARCKADFDAAAASRDQFTREILPRTMGAVRRRVEAEGLVLGGRPAMIDRLRRALMILLPVSALAAVFLLARKPAHPAGDDGDILAKGGPTLSLFARRGDKVFSVHEGSGPGPSDRLRAGDAVRVVVRPGKSGFALLGSVDGNGNATLWFPGNSDPTGAVNPNQQNELPGSLVLDASRGPERLFAIFFSSPVTPAKIDELRAALIALGARGPEAIAATRSVQVSSEQDAQTTFLIEKEAP